ncbi:MAG: type II toxin-antitoxin system PemK/MazF family toxin [Beijerinckiaceae bacterium]
MTKIAAAKPLPDAGDIVWVDFEPVRGSEQAGARPALVLSTRLMHEATRLTIICPVTKNANPWPAKVFLPNGLSVKGAILADQVRSVDRTARGFRFIDRVPEEILVQVRFKVAALMGLDLFNLRRLIGKE